MPSEPITITRTPSNTSHPALSNQPNQTVLTPSSSLSISPQTPFLPPPGSGLSPSTATPTANTSAGFFKWAASTLAKSPGPMSPPQKGFNIPAVVDQNDDKDHDHESHDSFEFGDYQDLKSRSWTTNGRRAVSMSVPPGQGVSGITSMLKGFGESQNTPPPGGVMADKVAKGQGVLRRLSLSGNNYRVSVTGYRFLSPT